MGTRSCSTGHLIVDSDSSLGRPSAPQDVCSGRTLLLRGHTPVGGRTYHQSQAGDYYRDTNLTNPQGSAYHHNGSQSNLSLTPRNLACRRSPSCHSAAHCLSTALTMVGRGHSHSNALPADRQSLRHDVEMSNAPRNTVMTSMNMFAGDLSRAQFRFAPLMAPGMMHRRARQNEGHGLFKVSKWSNKLSIALEARLLIFFIVSQVPWTDRERGGSSLSPLSGAQSTVRRRCRIMAFMNARLMLRPLPFHRTGQT